MWIKSILFGLVITIVTPAVIFPIIPDNNKAIEPYSVLIFVESVNKNSIGHGVGRLGGGTIISPQHIVTAASVIYGAESVLIGYGSTEVKNQRIKRTNIYQIHPKYNPLTGENDIAVLFLTLKNKLPLDDKTVSKIRLPKLPPKIGTVGTLGGYGYAGPNANKASESLQLVDLRVIGKQSCQNEFKINIRSQFCAIPLDRTSNVCLGDHGAGLVAAPEIEPTQPPPPPIPPVTTTEVPVAPTGAAVAVDNDDDDDAVVDPPVTPENVLIGVATMISSTCNQNAPSGYTNVNQFVVWISTVTNVFP